MKKIFIIFLMFIIPPAFSKTADSKNYNICADDIYLISIGALDRLKFEILEIQSKSGYILFQKNENIYLLAVTRGGENLSNIKITKLKQTSPLKEVQKEIYTEIENNLDNSFKKVL